MPNFLSPNAQEELAQNFLPAKLSSYMVVAMYGIKIVEYQLIGRCLGKLEFDKGS